MTGRGRRIRRAVSPEAGGKWSLSGERSRFDLGPPFSWPIVPDRKRANSPLTFLAPTIVLEIAP